MPDNGERLNVSSYYVCGGTYSHGRESFILQSDFTTVASSAFHNGSVRLVWGMKSQLSHFTDRHPKTRRLPTSQVAGRTGTCTGLITQLLTSEDSFLPGGLKQPEMSDFSLSLIPRGQEHSCHFSAAVRGKPS